MTPIEPATFWLLAQCLNQLRHHVPPFMVSSRVFTFTITLSDVLCGQRIRGWHRAGGAWVSTGRLHLKCDGTRAEARFRLSTKRTSPFKSAGTSVQSTAGSRGVRICGSNAGYTMFRGSVKSTGYPLHSPVSPSPPLSCVTVCRHISTGLYLDVVLRLRLRGALPILADVLTLWCFK
jgi:hypothetical protein